MILTPPYTVRQESSGLHAVAFFSLEIEFAQILYWIICANHFLDILEIGTADGHSTWWLAEAAAQTGGDVMTIDPVNSPERKNIIGEYERRERVYFIQANSREFSKTHKGCIWDLIYIDGGHTLQNIQEDFEFAKESVNPQHGMIAIHDTTSMADTVGAYISEASKHWGKWIHYPFGKGLSIGQVDRA